MQEREIAIVHYNTPDLTEATVLSIRRQCGDDYRITIFDNSERKPFTKKMDGVAIIDNTRGQIINFERELEKYPNKRRSQGCDGPCIYGSVKHMMTVEWLLQYFDRPFILADSDILFKSPIGNLFDEPCTAAGSIGMEWTFGIERLQPFLCYINAPECRRLGIHYFDPSRSWGLGTGETDRENWYDTGASFLEDLRHHPDAIFRRVAIFDTIIHLGGGSYRNLNTAPEWLHRHKELWNPDYEWHGTPTIISDINMDNVRVFTQDGRQYNLKANPGYLLKAKDTGDTYRQVNTMKLERWEVIPDPDAIKPEAANKPEANPDITSSRHNDITTEAKADGKASAPIAPKSPKPRKTRKPRKA